jgi:hypothetical protein
LGRHTKGLVIERIEIDEKGKLKVITEDGTELKTTRQERAILAHYKAQDYEDEIKHIFNNPHILSEEFRVISNGKYVYGKYV